MRRIIGTIAATLAIAIAFGATMLDRTSPSDDARNDGRFAGLDWEEDWFEDYESGMFGTTMSDCTSPSEGARKYGPLVDFVPWAQAHDKFVALRSREGAGLDRDIFAGGCSAAQLSAAITPPTWRGMSTPNGGEVITVD